MHENLNNVSFGKPDGGTNLHAGFKAAGEMFSGACATAKKYIVVMSDGEPTLFLGEKNDWNKHEF